MNSKHGFTMIEIILTATMLAVISTPFLLALTNLGFQYRNLRISYYAQLVAQGHMEKVVNALQGINPPSGTPDPNAYKNEFCSKVDITPTCSSISSNIPTKKYINNLDLTTGDPSITSISDTPPEITTHMENYSFTSQIILAPVCRDSARALKKSNPPNGDCNPGEQDPTSLEIIIITNWDPPGPLGNASYQISTLFTEFNPL